MPKTKDAITRLAVIDRCLRDEELTLTELTNKVNVELIAQHQSPVVKPTIVKDLNYITRRLRIEVEKKPKGKEFTLRYKVPSFSLFKSSLTLAELEKLNQIVDLIKDFTGLPQFDWLEKVRDRINISAHSESSKKPIVKFAHNPAMAQYRKFFNPLYEIIQNKKAIELTYQRFEADAPRTYVVHPYELMEYEARWYLVASVDHHPESLTTFGFDRIVEFKESNLPFRENTKFDTDEYYGSMVGLTRPNDAGLEEVLLRVENSEYPYLLTKPLHKSQKLVREEEGGKILSLHVVVNYELMMRLFSYNKFVTVLAPDDLRQKMKEIAEAIVRNYEM